MGCVVVKVPQQSNDMGGMFVIRYLCDLLKLWPRSRKVDINNKFDIEETWFTQNDVYLNRRTLLDTFEM